MDEITLRQMQSGALARRESITPAAPAGPREGSGSGASGSVAGPSFGDLLRERQAAGAANPSALKFSAHAQTRLQSRNIPFGPDEVARLEAAVGKAQARGARESLVLMDNVALVVSVKNRTVITAVDAASLKNNVFTNIDSAVIC